MADSRLGANAPRRLSAHIPLEFVELYSPFDVIMKQLWAACICLCADSPKRIRLPILYYLILGKFWRSGVQQNIL